MQAGKYNKKVSQQKNIGEKGGLRMGNRNISELVKPPMKCWGCSESHLWIYCPQNPLNKKETFNNIQESSTINVVACNIPRISATLDGRQTDHQLIIVEVQGKILEKDVSILIDLRSTLSYIPPFVVERCNLVKEKQIKPWLVQLDIRTKRKMTQISINCTVNLNGMHMTLNLNILPLVS